MVDGSMTSLNVALIAEFTATSVAALAGLVDETVGVDGLGELRVSVVAPR